MNAWLELVDGRIDASERSLETALKIGLQAPQNQALAQTFLGAIALERNDLARAKDRLAYARALPCNRAATAVIDRFAEKIAKAETAAKGG